MRPLNGKCRRSCHCRRSVSTYGVGIAAYRLLNVRASSRLSCARPRSRLRISNLCRRYSAVDILTNTSHPFRPSRSSTDRCTHPRSSSPDGTIGDWTQLCEPGPCSQNMRAESCVTGVVCLSPRVPTTRPDIMKVHHSMQLYEEHFVASITLTCCLPGTEAYEATAFRLLLCLVSPTT